MNSVDAAIGLFELGICLRAQQKLAEAEKMYVTSLSVFRTELSEDHAQTLTCCRHLAGLYVDTGKNQEAISLYSSIRVTYVRLFGTNHPETFFVTGQLASLLFIVGKLLEAENLLVPLLESMLEVENMSHDIATAYNTVACIYFKTKRKQEAAKLFAQSYAILKELLGSENSETVGVYANLKASIV